MTLDGMDAKRVKSPKFLADYTQKAHPEAFCLMWYACPCSHRERIWNSRDGVTPFGLQCPSCGGDTLLHVDWKLDQRNEKHALHRGQRCFADGSAQDALEIVERRIRYGAERGFVAPPEVAERLRKDAREQTGEWLKGWPIVRRHGE